MSWRDLAILVGLNLAILLAGVVVGAVIVRLAPRGHTECTGTLDPVLDHQGRCQ